MAGNSIYSNSKKLLAVYDLAAQPVSIGDVFVFSQAAYIKCGLYNADRVDFCFIADSSDLCVEDFRGMITDDNKYRHLLSIIPVVQFNPDLGSIYIFTEKNEFRKFLRDNSDEYVLYPTLEQMASKTYMFYKTCHLMDECYRLYGSIPFQKARMHMLDWAYDFIGSRNEEKVPVTVNIRNNPKLGTGRNSDVNVWIEFINMCSSQYPVKFFLICGFAEVDERFRNNENVVVVKDSCTDIVQDMTLVQAAAFHIGTASGPSQMAIFSEKPFFVTRADGIHYLDRYHGSLVYDGEYLRHSFGSDLQNLSPKIETVDLLMYEFDRMWQAVEKDSWLLPYDESKKAKGDITWLR